MNEPAREPTSPVKPASANGRGEALPPEPPHELPELVLGATVRTFTADGQRWMARLAGRGACGTGSYGLGLVEAVHFAAAEEPTRPLREALVARGRFEALFDSELAQLLARAVPIVGLESR